MSLTVEQARALIRNRKTMRKAIVKAARGAKADARARRILELVEQGASHEELAAILRVRVDSVRGAIRVAKKRLASPS